jgi:hypothetical protein
MRVNETHSLRPVSKLLGFVLPAPHGYLVGHYCSESRGSPIATALALTGIVAIMFVLTLSE